MPLHHYLPATYLASFSNDTLTLPRRHRKISIGDKNDGRIFSTSVANVAAINNLYTLSATGNDPELIERIWAKCETDLDEAINLLITGEISAKSWIRVLVPFVACMLVRGPDFNKRFELRIRALGVDPEGQQMSRDNTNGARLLELQRLLGPITVSKWVVIRVRGQEPLITNDLGYAPFMNPNTGDTGIAIPLNLYHVLAVIPRNQGRIVLVKSGKWVPNIEYVDNLSDNHEELNKALSSIAQRYIFGPDDLTVGKWLQSSEVSPFPPEPVEFGFITDPLARAHEFTWHRLAATLERDPSDDDPWDFRLDWARLAQGWVPAIYFPTNLIEFPPALYRHENFISAEFYNPDVYYALSSVRELEQMGEFNLLLEEATKGLGLAQDNPQKVRFLVARAAGLDELERYDEAISDYGEALELEPHSVIALTNRAVTLLKLGRLEEASQDLDRALSLDPDLGVARVNRGTIYYLQGEPYAAVREISRALKFLPTGPMLGAAHLSRGNAHLILGDHRNAIEDFFTAAKHYADVKPKAYCEFRRAIALSDSGNDNAALQAIDASLELNDESFEAHLFKGQLSLKYGNLETAIIELTKAIEFGKQDSATAQAYNLRARAYLNQGIQNLALIDCDRAVELDNTDPAIHHDRGVLLLYMGEFEAAITAFNRSLELGQRNAGALNNRGIAHALQGNLDLAIEDHKESASLFGRSSEAGSPFRHLALAYASKGDLHSAIESIKKARRLDRGSPFNDQIESLICLYKGRFEDSLKLMSRVMAKHSDKADLKIYLSLPLAFLGKSDEARSLAEECLSIIKLPITRTQFIIHLRALRNKFPDEKGLADFSGRIDPTHM